MLASLSGVVMRMALCGCLSLLMLCAGVLSLRSMAPEVAARLLLSEASARFGMAYRALSTCGEGCDPEALSQALGGDGMRFMLKDDRDALPPGGRDGSLLLAQRLGLPPDAVLVWRGSHMGLGFTGFANLTMAARLPGGRWLEARSADLVKVLRLRNIFLVTLGGLAVMAAAGIYLYLQSRALRRLRDAVGGGREEPLHALSAHGPREIRELSAAFAAMRERVRCLLAERNRTLALVSHDLRTPLTALRLRAELIADEALREAMIRSLRDMQAVVDQSLELAGTIDAGMSEAFEEVDLAELIREVVDAQREFGHTVSMYLDESCVRACRVLALRRALTNLVENAVVHGGSARVTLQVRPIPRIIIDDDGPGIPDEWMERVFQPFARVRHERPGTGMGLTIARNFVVANRGRIQLENRAEGGLRVTVELPL